ncbi:MAG TPA: hypothetical protein H9825_00005, partial [Candidatus Sphingobacterium stercorigallinarum]|nr:hypothetical protein [Candidatus Sphingobacterium stercorigallinarum]
MTGIIKSRRVPEVNLLAMKIKRFATVRHWCLIGLFNLLLVAILRTFMRLEHVSPFMGQRSTNVLHAHSHFAFLGWVSGM